MTRYTYSHIDVLMADRDNPLPKEKRDFQLDRIKKALDNFLHAPEPTIEDWETLSDTVNLMETILIMGFVEDAQGAIPEAQEALGKSGSRSMRGKPLRLDGPAIGLLKGIIEDYEMVCENLSARTMIMAHRATEKRVQELMLKDLMMAKVAA